ncbi:MAG: NAD(P)H-dependent oxidoreductase subunit E [Halanaerobiales bacterium]|nr:NAD(P)H-dependent oxidoreductase subunit E [Halanaerobiales bacterium]
MSTITQKEEYIIDKNELKNVLTQFVDKERFEDDEYINRIKNRLEEILRENLNQSQNLIEVLHEVQGLVGFIPKYVQKEVAKALNLAPGEVTSVISFYAHFSENPKGKYQIAICKGTACYVKGSVDIIDRVKKEYDLQAGESTDDGLFSLEIVRCLGACGLGPVMTVNGKAHGLLNTEKAVNILKKYENKEM